MKNIKCGKTRSDSIDEAAYGTVYNTPIMTYRGGSLWQPRTSPIGWRADTKGHMGILFYLRTMWSRICKIFLNFIHVKTCLYKIFRCIIITEQKCKITVSLFLLSFLSFLLRFINFFSLIFFLIRRIHQCLACKTLDYGRLINKCILLRSIN